LARNYYTIQLYSGINFQTVAKYLVHKSWKKNIFRSIFIRFCFWKLFAGHTCVFEDVDLEPEYPIEHLHLFPLIWQLLNLFKNKRTKINLFKKCFSFIFHCWLEYKEPSCTNLNIFLFDQQLTIKLTVLGQMAKF
jgi:hypothetical protein